jgi:hypothetical protein
MTVATYKKEPPYKSALTTELCRELTEKSRAIPVHQPRLSISPALCWPLTPNSFTRKKVMTAPRGAANEKIRSRRLIWGGVRLRDIKVVVSPRAVGPARQLPSTRRLQLTLVYQDGEKDDKSQTSIPT